LQRVVGEKHTADDAVYCLPVPPANAVKPSFGWKKIVDHFIMQCYNYVVKMIHCLDSDMLLEVVP
jgi:hypothetical protein